MKLVSMDTGWHNGLLSQIGATETYSEANKANTKRVLSCVLAAWFGFCAINNCGNSYMSEDLYSKEGFSVISVTFEVVCAFF